MSVVTVLSNILIYLIVIILAVSCAIPIMYVISISLTGFNAFYNFGPSLIPREPTFVSYQILFSSGTRFLRALKNTTILTVMGVIISVFFNLVTGYGMARRGIPGRTAILQFLYVTSFFSGGLIPLFMVLRFFGLLDTYLAIILPAALNIGTCLLVKNYFISTVPPSLEESARLDGAHEFVILFKIVLPISMPIVAVLILFAAVAYWGTYSQALFFLRDGTKMPIMVLLYNTLVNYGGGTQNLGHVDISLAPGEGIKMAALVVSVMPIMMLYPFLQRHFAKGIIIGALKN